MARPSYREAVKWLSNFRDSKIDRDTNADLSDVPFVAGQLVTMLVADLWGQSAERVANDVLRYEGTGRDDPVATVRSYGE